MNYSRGATFEGLLSTIGIIGSLVTIGLIYILFHQQYSLYYFFLIVLMLLFFVPMAANVQGIHIDFNKRTYCRYYHFGWFKLYKEHRQYIDNDMKLILKYKTYAHSFSSSGGGKTYAVQSFNLYFQYVNGKTILIKEYPKHTIAWEEMLDLSQNLNISYEDYSFMGKQKLL